MFTESPMATGKPCSHQAIGTSPTRPVLRWHGGKWMLAPWIIAHMPPHRTYVEAYGGSGAVLLRKPRSHAEVWNDLDGDVVCLFRVLRSDRAAELLRSIELTPYARDEFQGSYEDACEEPVERARRLVIRSFMSFGTDGHNPGVRTGFRSRSPQSGTSPAASWANYPEALKLVIERLRAVVVENRPAQEVCLRHDSAQTLHYLDPPYLPMTRSRSFGNRGSYSHEMSQADHLDMLVWAHALTGMVMISGYPSALYDNGLPGWTRMERAALADGARKRVEALWINPALREALERSAAAGVLSLPAALP